jgi:hypothetical protein
MAYLRALLLALAVHSVIAVPTADKVKPYDKSFSIGQVKSKNPPVRNGLKALSAVYRKYGGVLPKEISVASSPGGSVVATPAANDREYTCPVQIGGQTVYLDFDTGSSDL